jgi:hypothetical protein
MRSQAVSFQHRITGTCPCLFRSSQCHLTSIVACLSPAHVRLLTSPDSLTFAKKRGCLFRGSPFSEVMFLLLRHTPDHMPGSKIISKFSAPSDLGEINIGAPVVRIVFRWVERKIKYKYFMQEATIQEIEKSVYIVPQITI